MHYFLYLFSVRLSLGRVETRSQSRLVDQRPAWRDSCLKALVAWLSLPPAMLSVASPHAAG